MIELVVAGTVFMTTHLGISSGLRGVFLRPFGERGYLVMYSLVAVATLGYLIHTYSALPHDQYVWWPSPALRMVAVVAMPFALVLLVGAFMTRNPTALGQEGTLAQDNTGHGVIRITRHPFQWAVVIWAVSHLVANGDLASIIFFGTLGGVSLLGTILIDRKKQASLGAEWQRFTRATSNVPFAAIAGGRNRLVLRELALPIVVGLVVFAVLYWAHPWISGVALVAR
jgi:uncharacterized membrane protein